MYFSRSKYFTSKSKLITYMYLYSTNRVYHFKVTNKAVKAAKKLSNVAKSSILAQM